VQPTYEINTGLWGRSYQESIYVRPTDSIDLSGNYFLPGTLGGDHSIKFGFKYRNDIAHSEGHYGGNAVARFRGGVASEALMYRDSLTEYKLMNRSFYASDSFTRKRMTLNLGLRFDYQTDEANPANVPANPFYGKATYAGDYVAGTGIPAAWTGTYTGATFPHLPALNFPGHDSGGVSYTNFSPRLGFTYDLLGDGRNVAKASYARYVSQVGTGSLSSTYNTVGAANLRYPWVDVNGDKFIQANEIVFTTAIAPLGGSAGGNYDWRNPTSATSTGKNDPNLTAAYTDEFIIGFDKAFGTQFGVSASYIWRKYSNFAWSPLDGWSSANYASTTYTPPATACPAGARCEAVTFFYPTSSVPSLYTYTNRPDYSRNYQGFEVTGRKRMSNNWSMNVSYAYNNAPVHYDSPAAYQDPTNIDKYNGGQFAEESTSSGLGNVFVNAKWIFRLSGIYTTPLWAINVSGFYNARGGYPFQATVLAGSSPLAYGGGNTDILLDLWGDNRLPNFQTLDFRVDKSFTLYSRVKIVPAMDIFNLFNGSTSLSIRGRQNASNANTISSILAPRVIRFGARVTW
jgi:hypothetical protein